MSELPSGTILGKLVAEQVLEFYDFPRIFTCRNSTGQSYFVISTYDDDLVFDWLYLPVSSLRLRSILAGGMTLHEAYRHPEGGFLLAVRTSFDYQATVNFLLPEQVPQEDLPLPSYVVKTDRLTNDSAEYIPPKQVALATRCETFDYHIYPGQPGCHEIPARKLGGVLATTQELIDALGQSSIGEATVRGAIPAELLQQTKVNVTHFFHGSFGVQFRATQFSDLLDQSMVSSAISELTNLLQAADSEDLLSNKLHALKGRVASKYRRLLKELADINSGLVLDWGAVKNDLGGRFYLTSDQVKRAYAIVDRIDIQMAQEIVVSGKLIGFNLRTKRYELLSGDDGKTYAGKVSDDAQIEVNNPAVGEFYAAKLRMLVETQSTSGDELIRWVLVSLSIRHTGEEP